MADVMPKMKLYVFISVINALIMLGYNIARISYEGNVDILGLLGGFGTSFIPFTSTVQVVLTGSFTVPVEVLAIAGIITAILSGIQAFILSTIVVNYLPFFDI